MNIDLREFKEIIQSTNMNVLIGAGASRPFLPALGNIESVIENATTEDAVLDQFRIYFNDVMLPSLSILNDGVLLSETNPTPDEQSPKTNFTKTYTSYKKFFELLNTVLLNRKSTLLNKQVNIFTTNIDIFMEKSLEDSNLEYNDGFTGSIMPIFRTSNFSKSVHKTSAHFSNISEIPTFNVMKLHGSLSWKLDAANNQMVYSHLEQLNDIQLHITNNDEFKHEYEKLQIVNPTKDKFKETVMGVTYYEMLRMYSSELEKENSVLFIIGFSMADEHIREITKRVANSNPTLKIYIFSYDNGTTLSNYQTWFSDMRYQNVAIVSPEGATRLDLETISEMYFETVIKNDKGSDNTPLDSDDQSEQEASDDPILESSVTDDPIEEMHEPI